MTGSLRTRYSSRYIPQTPLGGGRRKSLKGLEARAGIEPAHKGFADLSIGIMPICAVLYQIVIAAIYLISLSTGISPSNPALATKFATGLIFSLTFGALTSIPIEDMKTEYSSAEVAKLIKVSKRTLLEWLYSGKLPEPQSKTFGGVSSRIWSAADLERAKAFREQNYRKRS